MSHVPRVWTRRPSLRPRKALSGIPDQHVINKSRDYLSFHTVQSDENSTFGMLTFRANMGRKRRERVLVRQNEF
jgi:hypothetical protein